MPKEYLLPLLPDITKDAIQFAEEEMGVVNVHDTKVWEPDYEKGDAGSLTIVFRADIADKEKIIAYMLRYFPKDKHILKRSRHGETSW